MVHRSILQYTMVYGSNIVQSIRKSYGCVNDHDGKVRKMDSYYATLYYGIAYLSI